MSIERVHGILTGPIRSRAPLKKEKPADPESYYRAQVDQMIGRETEQQTADNIQHMVLMHQSIPKHKSAYPKE